MAYSKQTGSVGVFVIVAAVLAGLLIGGSFWLRANTEEMKISETSTKKVDKTETYEVANKSESTDNNGDQEKAAAEKRAAEDKAKQQEEALAAEQARNKQAEEQKTAAEAAQKAKTEEANTATVNNDTPNSKQAVVATADSLPKTGATEDALSMMVGAGSLVVASLAYRRSMRSTL